MQKDKKLEQNKALFKAIKKKKTWIVTEQKASTNFTTTKFYYLRLQKEEKKDQIKLPLFKKCAYKYLSN